MKNSAKQTETKKVEINSNILDLINASNVANKSENKSIFKKEHCNSQSRGKCRKQFINAISLFLLHSAHNKKELANEYLQKSKEIAKTYYIAEDKFQNATDYFTAGRGGNDVEIIKEFIKIVNS